MAHHYEGFIEAILTPDAAQARIAELESQLYQAAARSEQWERRTLAHCERADEIEAKLANAQAEAQRRKRLLEISDERVNRLSAQITELEAKLREAEAKVEAAEKQLEKTEEKLRNRDHFFRAETAERELAAAARVEGGDAKL
jgi:chromosome segregation ATPase